MDLLDRDSSPSGPWCPKPLQPTLYHRAGPTRRLSSELSSTSGGTDGGRSQQEGTQGVNPRNGFVSPFPIAAAFWPCPQARAAPCQLRQPAANRAPTF
jgi:hypothetical protein